MTSIQKKKLDTAFTRSWISAAVAGRMDALVSLLLVQLQHLENLVLETNFARSFVLVYRLAFLQHMCPGGIPDTIRKTEQPSAAVLLGILAYCKSRLSS